MDYSFEACTRTHVIPDTCLPEHVEAYQRFMHKWICLAFDRDKEFQLRQEPRK